MLTAHLEGPFSWPGLPDAPSIFDAPAGRACGVYLWTVPQDGDELIYYVGETGRSFATRLQEHYKEHVAGFYHLNEVRALKNGQRQMVWPGLWHAGKRETPVNCVRRFFDLAPLIEDLNQTYRFYVAPLTCTRRIRARVESAIYHALRDNPPPVGSFQEEGIRYHSRHAEEEPLPCQLLNGEQLRGLPREFDA